MKHVVVKPQKIPRPLAIENAIAPTEEPIPGLFVFENFIAPQEEQAILEELDSRPNDSWKMKQHSGCHGEKRWGVQHELWSRRVQPPVRPLPHFVKQILLPKLARVVQMQGCVPNEVNAIDYRRKQGHWLKQHADDRQKSKEPISNLSLAGDCYMTFCNEKCKTALASRKVLLKRGTLQIMTGAARYDFTHGIQNEDLLSDRRVSVTMREIPY